MRTAPLIVLTAILAAAATASAAPDDSGQVLQVHLPRTISVDAEQLRLGMISVVTAPDDTLAGKAAAIAMGRAPWSKEELVVDRSTILGRLASHGIRRDEVAFSGAEKIVVTRNEKVLKAEDLARAADAYVRTARPAPTGAQWRLLRGPDDLAVPVGCDVTLRPATVPHEVRGEARVEVAVMAADRKVGAADVLFRLAYERRHLVAKADIPEGGVITPENTDVRVAVADAPDAQDWASAYGQKALRMIPVGAMVRPGLIQPAQPRLLVRRNDNVVMKITGDLFQVTAVGQALEDGRQGDVIRVRNTDSKRVVVAKVVEDGTVQPVMDER